MKDIFTVALCTVKRYVKNPVVITVFVAAPLILFAFISGSKVDSFNITSPAVPGGTSVVNHYVKRPGGLKMTDCESLAFMLMCIFYFGVVSWHSIAGDIKNGVEQRFNASPVGPWRGILGKYLGNLFLCFAVSIAIAALGKLLFGIELFINPALTVAALFLFSTTAVNLGVMSTGFIKNIYVCFVFIFCVNFSMVYPAMTDIFSPLTSNAVFAVLNACSLDYHLLNVFSAQSIPALLPLLAAACVTFPAAILIGRKVME